MNASSKLPAYMDKRKTVAEDLSKANKIYYYVEMAKAIYPVDNTDGYKMSLDDLYGNEGLIQMLSPYQSRYNQVKDKSLTALVKGVLTDYDMYIKELEFLLREMNDVYQRFVFLQEKKKERYNKFVKNIEK